MKRKYMGLTALILVLALCLSACGTGMTTDTKGTTNGTNGTAAPGASPSVTVTPVPDNNGDVTDGNGHIGDEPAARDDGMASDSDTTGDRRTDGDNTGSAVGDMAKDAGNAVGDAARDAGDAIGNAADKVTGGNNSGNRNGTTTAKP